MSSNRDKKRILRHDTKENVEIEGNEETKPIHGAERLVDSYVQKAIQETEEKAHTIIIRNVPHHLYLRLRNVKSFYHAKSWVDMLEKVTKEFEEQIEEIEWL